MRAAAASRSSLQGLARALQRSPALEADKTAYLLLDTMQHSTLSADLCGGAWLAHPIGRRPPAAATSPPPPPAALLSCMAPVM